MPEIKLINDELDAKRIAALRSFGILDTAPEMGFNDIALLASQICETPVSLISFIDENRQWFKAAVGFEGSETPLEQAVCAQAIRQSDTFIIPDLTQDRRTHDNALVTEGPQIRFYAGALLKTQDGVALGTLCVIDTNPRPQGLTPTQTASLEALARQVMAQLELRKLLAEQATLMAERLVAEASARERQEILSDEIAHRLKNILAMVQAIASQTLRGAGDPAEARDALLKRIRALGDAHKILHRGQTQRAGIRVLIQDAINPMDYGDKKRFLLSGPDIEVNAKAALMLVLMIHELSTNATKYGALSIRCGRVAIAWSIAETVDGPTVTLTWQEKDGPIVIPPKHEGFGTRLIEKALAGTVGGKAHLDYAPTGLICTLTAPLEGFSGKDDVETVPVEPDDGEGGRAELVA